MGAEKREVVAWMGDDLIAPLVTEKQHAFFRDRGLTTDEWTIPLVPESLLLDARAEVERLEAVAAGHYNHKVRAEALAGERTSLLREVAEWISNWEPNFVDDEEWQPVADRIDTAIDAVGGRVEG